MFTLLTLYYVCFGVGLLYVLVAGALGLHGGSGHPGGGHELAGGHDAGGGLHDGGYAADAGDDDGIALAGHVPLGSQPASSADSGSEAAQYSPLNLLSVMCFSAAFGGTGLVTMALGAPELMTFPFALAGGFFMAWLLYVVLTRVLFRMQGGRTPGVDDMLGLEAEILTPIEGTHFGEIAYTMQGTRYTSPARLLHGERAGRADTVRIIKVVGGTAYVEVRRKLLD